MASSVDCLLTLNTSEGKKFESGVSKNNSWGRGRNAKFAIIVAILAFPIIVLFAFYSSLNVVATNTPLFNFLNLGSSNGIYETITPNYNLTTVVLNTSEIQNGQQFPNFFPSISIPGYYLIVMIVIVFLLVGLAVVRNVRRQNSVTGFDAGKDLEIQRIGVANVLDDAISELRRGNEYRLTVLECYRRIIELLEAKSSIDGKPLTAREFERTVSTSLKLNTPYLSQVTEIFELARYSRQEISRDEAELAIESLTKLSSVLRDVNSGT
jgi:hypothetical protein